MVIRNKREPKVPQYQLRWEGRRVEWRNIDGHHSGLVLEANLYEREEGRTVMLRVLRDDGYIQPGVFVDDVTESKPGDA